MTFSDPDSGYRPNSSSLANNTVIMIPIQQYFIEKIIIETKNIIFALYYYNTVLPHCKYGTKDFKKIFFLNYFWSERSDSESRLFSKVGSGKSRSNSSNKSFVYVHCIQYTKLLLFSSIGCCCWLLALFLFDSVE